MGGGKYNETKKKRIRKSVVENGRYTSVLLYEATFENIRGVFLSKKQKEI